MPANTSSVNTMIMTVIMTVVLAQAKPVKEADKLALQIETTMHP